MSGNTPGPWTFVPREEYRGPLVQRGREGGFYVQGSSERREDADARLIASAPMLLEALIEAEKYLIDSGKPFNSLAIHQAIALATGETR